MNNEEGVVCLGSEFFMKTDMHYIFDGLWCQQDDSVSFALLKSVTFGRVSTDKNSI